MARKFDFPIEVGDLSEHVGAPVDPGLSGYVAVKRLEGDPDGAFEVWARAKPDADIEMFTVWADQRIERFMEHGAEPDGWFKQSDGKWALWARVVEMPSLE